MPVRTYTYWRMEQANTCILLVTGARVLDDSARMRQWAKTLLLARIMELKLEFAEVKVISGDATGPDIWSREAVIQLSEMMKGLSHHQFNLDGNVYSIDRKPSLWTSRTPPKHGDPGYTKWPLYRNEEMVRTVGRRQERDVFSVLEGLGFTAPWSRTQGTKHTLQLMRALPFREIREAECPEDLRT